MSTLSFRCSEERSPERALHLLSALFHLSLTGERAGFFSFKGCWVLVLAHQVTLLLLCEGGPN